MSITAVDDILPFAPTKNSCLNGVGLSASFSLSRVWASDTEMPSFTNAAAALRTAGVIRLNVPISSSFPHRPQLEMSFIIWTTSSRVGFFGVGAAPGAWA